MAPGAFFVLAFLVAIMNKVKMKKVIPIVLNYIRIMDIMDV